ncbi:biotin-dependent carboxyltransferase family protein [Aeromicrobium sp. CF3.5]|uniref:5-oxoprolinase subunit C family protein n=1 Tax=Aeromicrobium sp. CF3.5 TaxID=3373078 RepID=UPI003EE7A4F4
MMRSLTVHASGPLALVQDLGRAGQAGIGVGRSGAADRTALRQGNRALGNDESAAGVEVTGGGLDVEVGDELIMMCVSGARCDVTIDGGAVGSHSVVSAPAGSRVRLGPPTGGLRAYLCVRGGVDVPEVMGSRSHDVLSGLGPDPLAAGEVLPVGASRGEFPQVDYLVCPRWDDPVVLRAVLGPRQGWVTDPDLLVAQPWQATQDINRVGMRLSGATFERARPDQLPSEGIWRGAIQVSPSGEPVLFLADHPVTGGYPVVAVVIDEDVDRAAQVQPGQSLTFRWVEAP